jgi:hypothetical protein
MQFKDNTIFKNKPHLKGICLNSKIEYEKLYTTKIHNNTIFRIFNSVNTGKQLYILFGSSGVDIFYGCHLI